MEALLTAILEDDRGRVRQLLKKDPVLAARLVDRPKLYQSAIFHWLYARDSALHLAAAGYRVEIAKALLRAGANPNGAANHRHGTPLHYAADGYITGPAWNPKRQTKMISCLLEAGARIDLADKNGATPLHRAVRTRCADAVAFLLESGANPLLRNVSGSTPFHLAAQNTGRGGAGSEEAKSAQRQIIATFLRFGVNTALRDGNGKSVAACAKSPQVREWLTSQPPV